MPFAMRALHIILSIIIKFLGVLSTRETMRAPSRGRSKGLPGVEDLGRPNDGTVNERNRDVKRWIALTDRQNATRATPSREPLR